MQDGTATGCNRVDAHHRRAHTNTGHFGFKGTFKLAVKMRDVRRRAAHVKSDQLLKTRHATGFNHADDTTGRTRQDCVLALEQFGRGQSAGGLHEHQAAAGTFGAELGCHLIDIAAQDGRQVGIHNGGVATTDQFHQR